LIPTHALPPLSYRVPPGLRPGVGSVVVAPLSGRPRLGVVVGLEASDERATESLVSVADEIKLPESTVRLCEWAAEQSAVSPAAALRAALPPGVETDSYLVVSPKPGWKWKKGERAGRVALKRALGEEALRAAESEGRVERLARLPKARSVEWVVSANGATPDFRPDFGRAYRQKELFEALRERGGACSVPDLLEQTGASRATLRSLAGRGLVKLENRAPEVFVTSSGEGGGAADPDFSPVSRALEGGGVCLWRTPSRDAPQCVAALGEAVLGRGEKLLVLAPEVRSVRALARHLRRRLPKGARISVYHGESGRERAETWKLAGRGEIDVLVGTRSAALVPFEGLGAICVADEPNPAYRAEPGYEGLPIHARDVAKRRAETEGIPALFLSPTPSLRLYASLKDSELPARRSRFWPSVRLVDMRGSGATLSSTLVSECRDAAESGESVGVIVDRLGGATSVSCANCGRVRACPKCDIPLSLRKRTLVCARCGHRERHTRECPGCGSERLSPAGMAVERVRERLSELLSAEVGLLTAKERELEHAPVVVGTARPILAREWDLVAVPDSDAFLTGAWMGSTERAFRAFYRAAESARRLLVVQTRDPENYALQAALREDYRGFAAAELPRLERLGYPPFAHLASLTFRGPEDGARHAVKSLPAFDGVEISEAVGVPGSPGLRVLLRSRSKEAVARAANEAARRLSKSAKRATSITVEIDPEEV
jgi:primosomal protein N' (replication factor Y) (superfamily II helicase)